MTCGFNQPINTHPRCCDGRPTPPKATVQFCDPCDPCSPEVSNVKLCAFVVPTLEEGRYFRNSFVFVQEDDTVYYISDNRSEIPFGSRPRFVDDYDPTTAAPTPKNAVIYDVKNKVAYVYGDDGYTSFAMTNNPIVSLQAGSGIEVNNASGVYTISVDSSVAKASDLESLNTLVKSQTNTINTLKTSVSDLQETVAPMAEDIQTALNTADDANSRAVEANANATAATSAARTASESAATAQSTADSATATANAANTAATTAGEKADNALAKANAVQENLDELEGNISGDFSNKVDKSASSGQSTTKVENDGATAALTATANDQTATVKSAYGNIGLGNMLYTNMEAGNSRILVAGNGNVYLNKNEAISTDQGNSLMKRSEVEAEIESAVSEGTSELTEEVTTLSDSVEQLTANLANKANTATTLAGYGITDAYTKAEVDAKIPAEYTTLVELPFKFPSSPNKGLPFTLQAGDSDVIPDGVTPVDDSGTTAGDFAARNLYTDVFEFTDLPGCVYLETGKNYRVSLISSAQVESRTTGAYSFPHIATFSYATHNGSQTIIYNNTNYTTQTVPGVLSVEITPTTSGNYYFGAILYSKDILSTGNTNYVFDENGEVLPFIRVRIEEKK